MTCGDATYQKLCAGIHRWVPCCEEIDGRNLSYHPKPWNISDKASLTEIFEVAKEITQKGLVRFRFQGTCMYPYLRPGDILHVEPKTAQEIETGDIAVFRRGDRLYAHRTIDKEKDGDSHYIVTRPDTAGYEDGEASVDEEILGIVSSIERKGEVIDPARKDHILAERVFLNSWLQWYSFKQNQFRKTVGYIAYLQQSRIYRKTAGFLFSMLKRRIDFSIQIPLDSNITSRFHRTVSLDDFLDRDIGRLEEDSIPMWTLTTQVGSRQLGFLAFIRRPESCPFSGWWLLDGRVRMRYRGTGVEESLLATTGRLFRSLGVSHIYTSCFRGDTLGRRIFRNWGFEECHSHEDQVSVNGGDREANRIIMRKQIAQSSLSVPKTSTPPRTHPR